VNYFGLNWCLVCVLLAVACLGFFRGCVVIIVGFFYVRALLSGGVVVCLRYFYLFVVFLCVGVFGGFLCFLVFFRCFLCVVFVMGGFVLCILLVWLLFIVGGFVFIGCWF